MPHADLPDAGRISHFGIDAQLPEVAEKAALLGAPGPPGPANRYLTENHAAGGFDGFANPTASVGLAAVNGVATTAMRSDGAPALDQGIVPTWTGLHTFEAGVVVEVDLAAALQVNQADTTNVLTVDTVNARVGILDSSPSFPLDIAGKVGIDGQQVIYVPDQTDFLGTLVLGDGGANLDHGIGGTRGQRNVFIGFGAGVADTTGQGNLFVGSLAGNANTTGQQNVFLGYLAGEANISGSYNMFQGTLAGASNTTGSFLVCVGYRAGIANTTASNNVYMGYNAGAANITGAKNVFIGTGAGLDTTTGSENIFIGRSAGANSTGDGNIFIGYQAGFQVVAGDNLLYIANSNTATPLLLGDFTAGLTIHSQAAAAVGLTVKGAAAQTADLQQWQDSAGAVLAVVDEAGSAGFGTSSPDRRLHAEVASAVTASVVRVQRLSHTTSGAAAPLFGVGQEHELEDAGGAMQVASETVTLWATATAGAESPLYRGTTHPVGVAGPGYWGFWTWDDLDDNARTIVPDGVGDVKSGVTIMYWLSESGGGAEGNVVMVANGGTVDLYDDGTDVFTLTVGAGGLVTVVRSAGATTADLSLLMCWL